MNAITKLVTRVLAVSICVGSVLMIPGAAVAGVLNVSFSSLFSGQIEFPNSIFPLLVNPTASGTATIDMAAPHASSGSATVSAPQGSYGLPNTVVFGVVDGATDQFGIQWNLIDGNSDIFHLSVTFQDTTGLGVSGTSLTSSVGGWTVLGARLDRGSDNVCCHINPMDVSSGTFSITASGVPEPGTMLLLSLGLAGLAGFGRRKHA